MVIIVIIGAVALVDHLDSRRISEVDQPTTPVQVPVKGGSAAVTLDQPWSGFNPNTPAGADSSTTTLLTSVLPSAYVVNSKLIPQVNSDLLLSVEVRSTAPLVIQYVINSKATWSDGVPVSAADFIYAWHSQRGDGVDVDGRPDQVAATLGYRDISSVNSSDKGKTVTFTFTSPFTDWRLLFDHMVPAHIASQVGWNTGFSKFDPKLDLSAGPMILQSVDGNARAVLVRNPRWWGTPALLDRITVVSTGGPAAWTRRLDSDSRAVLQVNGFDLAALGAVSSLPGTQSSVQPSLRFLQLEFNTKAVVTGKVAVREALAHLVDRPELLSQTFGGIDPSLVLNGSHLADAALPAYNASSAAGQYATPDVVTADRLLESVGYQRNAAGEFVDAAGAPLTIRMAVETGDPWIGEVGSEIAAELRGNGIPVTVDPVDGVSGMEAAASAGSYDITLVTRTASPYMTTTVDWYTEDQGPIGSQQGQDWSKFDDPEVDQLFAQSASELNPVTGGSVYEQIDDQLWDQMVALPLFAEPSLVATGSQLEGVQFNPTVDGVLWNAALWTALEPQPVKESS